MPADIKITRYRAERDEQVKLTASLVFDAGDPIGANIYRGFDALVGAIMSPESADEFLAKVVAIRKNPRGGTVSGRVKA